VLNKDAYVPPVLETPIYLGSNWNVTEEMLRQEGNEAIKYAETVAENEKIDYEGLVLEGDPASTILEFAVQNKIDIIVMGTLGKGGLERFLLGSVTDKVVRNSKVSVLVVKKQKQN
jgi:Universal stress protein UspA and related nucleotide-binding proteins